MGFYKINWKKSATKELKRIDKSKIRILVQAVNQLAFEPHPPGSKKLSNSECTYRIRIGSYRIIYDIYENENSIIIIRIRHRKDAYNP